MEKKITPLFSLISTWNLAYPSIIERGISALKSQILHTTLWLLQISQWLVCIDPYFEIMVFKWCTARCCDLNTHKEAFIFDITYLLLFDILIILYSSIWLMSFVILCILSHAFIQNVILRRGPQASLLNCRTVHGTNAFSPLPHCLWPKQRSPQPARSMLPKGILSSRVSLWCVLLFSSLLRKYFLRGGGTSGHRVRNWCDCPWTHKTWSPL